MAYSNFTLQQLIKDFSLSLHEASDYFSDRPLGEPSPTLVGLLQENIDLAIAINTEKARSEMIIAPVLWDIRRQCKTPISLFSGSEFSIDPEKGLTGVCDFILSKSSEQLLISSPVVTLVEAKNENLKNGLAQCIAEMVAAQIFNEQENNPIPAIYGVVTSGTLWRFLQLIQTDVYIDLSEYHIKTELPTILGILLHALE
jgi:hypothetical protein